jgi:hypothetical protein
MQNKIKIKYKEKRKVIEGSFLSKVCNYLATEHSKGSSGKQRYPAGIHPPSRSHQLLTLAPSGTNI